MAESSKVIPVFQPLLEAEELDACRQALEDGWLGMGRSVGHFEDELSAFLALGDRRIAAVSTGHAALHLAMLVAGVGRGDEVITPSFNNIADLQAVLACGATPVFCDVRDDTLCIDLEQVEGLLSPRTKAIVATDYGCHLSDHDHLGALREAHGVRAIHDAAHSFGATYNNRMIGSFSDIAIFSFDPVKTITCIDGGAVVVQSQEELESLHEMRLIGMGQAASVMYQNQRAWSYDVKRIGFRYHLANLHAALGLSQLQKMERITANRRRYFDIYTSRLDGINQLRTPKTTHPGSVPFLFYVRVPSEVRVPFRQHLSAHGVDTGIHWQPGHLMQLFEGCPRGDLSVTEVVGQEIVSLPFHSSMSDGTIERVVEAARSFWN